MLSLRVIDEDIIQVGIVEKHVSCIRLYHRADEGVGEGLT